MKYTDTAIPFPLTCEDLQYECEMVVAIVEGGSNILEEDALKHVYGYSVGVDLTRRDLQREAKEMRRPWDTSKGFDKSAPCGLLIPVKERGHIREGCVMEMSLNGKVVQKTELRNMIWKVTNCVVEYCKICFDQVNEMISYLSRYFCLQPGDLIMTGTPAGVGSLVPGDRIECLVTGLPPCKFTIGDKGSTLKQADKGVRRVVTGHDENGQSLILQDSRAPNTFCPPMREGVQVNNVWRHFGSVPELSLVTEETCEYGQKIPLLPPKEGGAVFRVIEFSPEAPWIEKVSINRPIEIYDD